MEPNYVGANQHIDAMAVAWLFAEDYIFFNPGEITWDGRHHGIAGAQINAAKMEEIPTLMGNPNMYFQGIGDLLMTLENDEELVVPRERIHPGLYDAIREGDLTGITLFNLQACAHAFQFLGEGNENVKISMIQTAGLGNLVDNPNAMACTHVVTVDQRLTRGIPGFYRLVTRMFEDMQAYNALDLPYVLLFTAVRNFDADQCLGPVDNDVEGAVSESLHVETNIEEWKASHGARDSSPEPDAENTEDGNEREVQLQLLRTLVLAGELVGTEYPKQLLEELERAESGDEGVDVENLMSRFQAASPTNTEIDPLSWTYVRGTRAKGPAFSVAIPDGYNVYNDVEDGIAGHRPFVAVVSGTGRDALAGSDKIVYVDRGLMGALADEETISMFREWATTDILVYLQRSAVVESYDLGVRVLEDRLVSCVNGKCLVSRRKNFDSCEFYIVPLMFNSSAWLKVGLSQCPAEEADKYMDAVCELAATVELVEPPVSDLVRKTQTFRGKSASADEIIETFEQLCKPMLFARQQEINAAHKLFLKQNAMYSPQDEAFCQARALTRWGDENLDVLQLLVDVYEAQRKAGMPYDEQRKLYEYMSDDFCTLYKMNLGHEGDEWDVKAKRAGVLRLPAGYDKLRKRWEAMRPQKNPLVEVSVAGPNEVMPKRTAQAVIQPESKKSKKPAEQTQEPSPRSTTPPIPDDEAKRLLVERISKYSSAKTMRRPSVLSKALGGSERQSQAESVLEAAWAEGLLRRAASGTTDFLYGRPYTPDEWKVQLGEIRQNLDQAYEKRVREERAAFDLRVSNDLQKAKEDVATRRNPLGKAEGELASLRQDADTLASKVTVKRDALVDMRQSLDALQAELKEAGFFAFGKKRELKGRIDEAEAAMQSCEDELTGLRKTADFIDAKMIAKAAQVEAARAELTRAEQVLEEARVASETPFEPSPYDEGELMACLEDLLLAWGIPASRDWLAKQLAGLTEEARADQVIDLGMERGRIVRVKGGLLTTYQLRQTAVGISDEEARPGNTILFGSVMLGGEMHVLPWRVLKRDSRNKRALLLCDLVIKDAPFCKGRTRASWHESTLAAWLQSEFVEDAFTAGERRQIVRKRGVGTVFLLSADEFKEGKRKKLVTPPEVPFAHSPFRKNEWWLRDSSEQTTRAKVITEKNNVSNKGRGVLNSGIGVRPAMWVRYEETK